MTDTKTFAETIHIDISIDISFNIYINIGIDSKTYTYLQIIDKLRKKTLNLTLVAPHCGFEDYELS